MRCALLTPHPACAALCAEAMAAIVDDIVSCDFDQVGPEEPSASQWEYVLLLRMCRAELVGPWPPVPQQVVVAHGDLVLAPGGKRAFAEGAAAFYKDVAARRRHHQHASSLRMHPALVAAAAVAGIAAVLWWRSG
jgi:hypothetical protein